MSAYEWSEEEVVHLGHTGGGGCGDDRLVCHGEGGGVQAMRASCARGGHVGGRPKTRVEAAPIEPASAPAVTIRCRACGTTIGAGAYWQALKKARLGGWDVKARLCPACQESAP